MSGNDSKPRPVPDLGWSRLVGAAQKIKEYVMGLVDGEGKEIPPGSWGGDLDPPQQAACRDCGTPIPFGKFCPTHLAEHQKANEEIMQQRREAAGADSNAPPPPPTARAVQEPVDMTVAMAKAQERAQAIVTPGMTPEPTTTDHLAKSGPAGAAPMQQPPPQDTTRTVGLNDMPPNPAPSLVLPAAAQDRVGLQRRSDDFLIGQAVMWIGELRGLVEDGKVRRDLAAELLQHCAELTYALAALCK